MIAVLIIALAVGGFFAYKKFGPKKEVKQAPKASTSIKSTTVKGGGSPTTSDSGYYTTNRKAEK